MKRFLIPATLLLIILLTAFGYNNSDNIFAPESKIEILAAPKADDYEYKEKFIRASGHSQISLSEGTRLEIPSKCLAEDTLINMTRHTNKNAGRIHFEFGPHGTIFNNGKNKQVQLELSWSTLKDVNPGELTLYYYDENENKWVIETTAEWNNNEKKAVLRIDHFSKYYYNRN